MRLDVIYQESTGILSHAERDFYLAYCSFADKLTGYVFAKKQTVAARAGMVPQSASRMYKKLVERGFLEIVPTGHNCLIGFDETKHSVKFAASQTKHDVNKTKPVVKSTKHDVKLHNKEVLTSHLTSQLPKNEKEPDPPELIAFRKTLSDFQRTYAAPTTKGKAIANTNSIRALFVLASGDSELCIEAHRFFQSEEWRKGRVDWVAVQKDFTAFEAYKRNGTNQKPNGSYRDPEQVKRDSEAFINQKFGIG